MQKPSKKSASAKTKKGAAIDPEAAAERKRRISTLAYAIGARRGFEGGADEAREDWIEAERQIELEDAK